MTTRPVETVGYRAPLAVLPVDDVTGRSVPDGVVVAAWPPGRPGESRTARHSPVSALLGFLSLPGLREQEHAVAPGWTAPVWPPVTPRPFHVRITDTLGRYLPQVRSVDVPARAPLEVRLASAPARPRPPGWAAVTGLIRVAPGRTPAGWAIVEVDDGATTYAGLCDARGAFALYLPYPEALPPLTSPSTAAGAAGLTWPLTVAIRYQPGVQRPLDAGDVPAIDTIHDQALARIVTTTGPVGDVPATLHLGPALALTLDVAPAAAT